MGVLVATLASLLIGAPSASAYHLHILGNPTSGDEFGFRPAMQQYAQDRSNRMFGALASLLGGEAPGLNFAPPGSQFASNHMSANVIDQTGAPKGTINVDPLAAESIIDD